MHWIPHINFNYRSFRSALNKLTNPIVIALQFIKEPLTTTITGWFFLKEAEQIPENPVAVLTALNILVLRYYLRPYIDQGFINVLSSLTSPELERQTRYQPKSITLELEQVADSLPVRASCMVVTCYSYSDRLQELIVKLFLSDSSALQSCLNHTAYSMLARAFFYKLYSQRQKTADAKITIPAAISMVVLRWFNLPLPHLIFLDHLIYLLAAIESRILPIAALNRILKNPETKQTLLTECWEQLPYNLQTIFSNLQILPRLYNTISKIPSQILPRALPSTEILPSVASCYALCGTNLFLVLAPLPHDWLIKPAAQLAGDRLKKYVELLFEGEYFLLVIRAVPKIFQFLQQETVNHLPYQLSELELGALFQYALRFLNFLERGRRIRVELLLNHPSWLNPNAHWHTRLSSRFNNSTLKKLFSEIHQQHPEQEFYLKAMLENAPKTLELIKYLVRAVGAPQSLSLTHKPNDILDIAHVLSRSLVRFEKNNIYLLTAFLIVINKFLKQSIENLTYEEGTNLFPFYFIIAANCKLAQATIEETKKISEAQKHELSEEEQKLLIKSRDDSEKCLQTLCERGQLPEIKAFEEIFKKEFELNKNSLINLSYCLLLFNLPEDNKLHKELLQWTSVAFIVDRVTEFFEKTTTSAFDENDIVRREGVSLELDYIERVIEQLAVMKKWSDGNETKSHTAAKQKLDGLYHKFFRAHIEEQNSSLIELGLQPLNFSRS